MNTKNLLIIPIITLFISCSGCELLASKFLSSSAPSISAQIGDRSFKAHGNDQNIHQNNGNVVGGDQHRITSAQTVNIQGFSKIHFILYTIFVFLLGAFTFSDIEKIIIKSLKKLFSRRA